MGCFTYDLVKAYPDLKSRVALTTFNGLGAQQGLVNNGGYDASVMAGVNNTAFVAKKDPVSCLGGGSMNADGKVDTADSLWSKLRLWVDANHNGYTNSGCSGFMCTSFAVHPR